MTMLILSRPSPTSAQCRRRRANVKPHQTDLFSDMLAMSLMQTPAWPELPKDARASLTSLLTRLLLDHAHASAAVATKEIIHDL